MWTRDLNPVRPILGTKGLGCVHPLKLGGNAIVAAFVKNSLKHLQIRKQAMVEIAMKRMSANVGIALK
jgi:hypothetical protein